MSYYCSYKDCPNIQRSFSSKTFFNLPTDARREIWIKNSGNEKLQRVEPNLRRVFCEDHFDAKYLRRQFNRTLLRREAIPYVYGEAPDSHEIEFIETTESDEEREKNQDDLRIEATNEQTELVIVINKSPNAPVKKIGLPQRILNKSAEVKAKTLPKILKRTHTASVQEDQHIELDLNTLDEEQIHSEDNKNGYDDVPSKRLAQESTKDAKNNPETAKTERIENHSKSECKKPAADVSLLKKLSSDGIVSSSETFDATNEETYFALSLVGILKRLPPHKRALAKCHILSYLTELEYGSSSDS